MKVEYVAFDGQRFFSEADCREHEKKRGPMRLVGLTHEDVERAISREDLALADAIEEIGALIARARRASGDKKRIHKPKNDGAQAAEAHA